MVQPHDERALLLLGLLSSHPQHGYQINEFIAQNLGRVSLMKKATAYALLSRLEKEGLVEAEEDREGNRPTRRVYSITNQGLAEMDAMLDLVLSSPEYEPPYGDIAVMLMDSLSSDRVISLLEKRLLWMDAEIDHMASAPPHEGHHQSIDLALDRRLAVMRADRAWFETVLTRLRRGELITTGSQTGEGETSHG